MYYKVKIRWPDKQFSNYIREKAGWACQKCGKVCKVGDEWIGKLEASHYWSRDHENTRYDEENVYSLCFVCHKRMGGYKREEDGEYDLWVKELLGEKGYKNLKIRANINSKRDDKLANMFVNQLLKELKQND